MDKLVDKVKKELGILTDDVDVTAQVKQKVEAVVCYLISAGANFERNLVTDEIDSDKITPSQSSCIAIGVNDLLNNKAGGVKFSPAFYVFAQQICRG